MVIQWEFRTMSHVATEKAKLLNRVRRLRGQIEAIERAVEADDGCADVLQQATSCRGALDGFIAEVIEDHIREHLVDPNAGRETPQALAAEELIEIVHQYLKK
jgi:DNA-binding FrmR family transcriptional regulator